MFCDPGRPVRPRPVQDGRAAPASDTTKAPTSTPFRGSIAWPSSSLSTLRRVDHPTQRKTRFQVLVRLSWTGLLTRKVPSKGFRVVSYISFPFPQAWLGANPIGALHSAADTSSLCVDRIMETVDASPVASQIKEEPRMMRALQSLKSNTDVIVTASERIGTIVQSLKNFARLDEAAFQKADVHEGLESTLTLLQHEMKSRIEIVKEFGELPEVHCYANQLNQVFMNVLTNAMQAIEESGTVTIQTRTDGSDVLVTIADTGVGIPSEDLPRIFDPGFTTRGVGVGTGLGLSTSYNILENHGARALVDSEVGKGTRFTIVLPIDHAGADDMPGS